MKSADKNILLLASLVKIFKIDKEELYTIIPTLDSERLNERMDEVESSLPDRKSIEKLLMELYKNGVKKGLLK